MIKRPGAEKGLRLATVIIACFMAIQVLVNLLFGLLQLDVINLSTFKGADNFFMITGFLSLFSGILPIVAGAIFLRYRNSYIQGRKKLIVGSVLMMAILPGLFLQVLLSYLFSLQTILVHQVQTGLYSYETITLPIDQTAQFILLSIGALFVGLVLLNRVGKILLRVSTAFYSLYPIMGMVEWIFSSSIHPSGLTWEAIFLHTYNSQFELIIATLIACISFLFFHANKDGPSKTITSQSKTETAANGAEDNTIIVFEK